MPSKLSLTQAPASSFRKWPPKFCQIFTILCKIPQNITKPYYIMFHTYATSIFLSLCFDSKRWHTFFCMLHSCLNNSSVVAENKNFDSLSSSKTDSIGKGMSRFLCVASWEGQNPVTAQARLWTQSVEGLQKPSTTKSFKICVWRPKFLLEYTPEAIKPLNNWVFKLKPPPGLVKSSPVRSHGSVFCSSTLPRIFFQGFGRFSVGFGWVVGWVGGLTPQEGDCGGWTREEMSPGGHYENLLSCSHVWSIFFVIGIGKPPLMYRGWVQAQTQNAHTPKNIAVEMEDGFNNWASTQSFCQGTFKIFVFSFFSAKYPSSIATMNCTRLLFKSEEPIPGPLQGAEARVWVSARIWGGVPQGSRIGLGGWGDPPLPLGS